MARINAFEDIIAWQKAQDLTLAIYKELAQCRDFSFRDQIQRATISIMNNIAEGFERKGDKEFKHYLFIAKGSCSEVRSMLSVADKLGYINQQECEKLKSLTIEITKMLAVFISKLDK
jgi:four helix bundle protein